VDVGRLDEARRAGVLRRSQHEPLEIGVARAREHALEHVACAVRGHEAQGAVGLAAKRAQRPELEAHEAEIDRPRQRAIGPQIARHDLAERTLERELLYPARRRVLRGAPRPCVAQVYLREGLLRARDAHDHGVDRKARRHRSRGGRRSRLRGELERDDAGHVRQRRVRQHGGRVRVEELGERLADDLLAGAAQHPLHRGVRLRDALPEIERQHAVRGLLHERAEQPVARREAGPCDRGRDDLREALEQRDRVLGRRAEHVVADEPPPVPDPEVNERQPHVALQAGAPTHEPERRGPRGHVRDDAGLGLRGVGAHALRHLRRGDARADGRLGARRGAGRVRAPEDAEAPARVLLDEHDRAIEGDDRAQGVRDGGEDVLPEPADAPEDRAHGGVDDGLLGGAGHERSHASTRPRTSGPGAGGSRPSSTVNAARTRASSAGDGAFV